MQTKDNPTLLLAVIKTFALIVFVREGAVLICEAFGYKEAGNIIGLVVLFCTLLTWRWKFGLPKWLTRGSNLILLDSGFAFLPVAAGSGLLLIALANEFFSFAVVVLISTLLPLWGLATLADRWLSTHQPK